MSLVAIGIVALGAVFLALNQVYSKYFQQGDWQERTAAVVVLQMVGASALAFAVSAATGGPEIGPGFATAVTVTGVLNIGIRYASMRARAIEDVSLVSPIDSTTPAIVIVTSMIILGERPSTLGWVGIGTMVAGTYVLNIREVWDRLAERAAPRGDPRIAVPVRQLRRQLAIWFAPFVALRRSAGVRWAFGAVLLSTVSLNYDGLAARSANVAFAYACVLVITGAGNLVIAVARKEFSGVTVSGAVSRSAILGSILAIGGVVTWWSYRFTIVPYSGTMQRLRIPLAIILAHFILKERKNLRERLGGGLLIALGATLIALG